MLFDNCCRIFFISKIYLHFSIGTGQHMGTGTVPIVSAHFRFLYGSAKATTWVDIKRETGCYLMTPETESQVSLNRKNPCGDFSQIFSLYPPLWSLLGLYSAFRSIAFNLGGFGTKSSLISYQRLPVKQRKNCSWVQFLTARRPMRRFFLVGQSPPLPYGSRSALMVDFLCFKRR